MPSGTTSLALSFDWQYPHGTIPQIAPLLDPRTELEPWDHEPRPQPQNLEAELPPQDLSSGSILCSFPVELLMEIFSWACVSITSPSNRRCACLCHAENRITLRLSVVCRQWREITLSMPELWSHIAFEAHRETRCLDREAVALKSAQTLQVVEEYLTWSGSTALSVILISRHDHSPADIVDRIISRVFSECHRWRSCHLDIPFSDRWVPASRCLPALKHLTLQTLPRFSQFHTPLQLPRIRSLHLHRFDFDPNQIPVTRCFDLANLDFLLWKSAMASVESLLDLCMRLASLTTLEIQSDLLSIESGQAVTLSSLTTLKTSFISFASLTLFERLVLPNLRNLQITFKNTFTGLLGSNVLTAHIKRSGYTLLGLTLICLHISDIDLVEILTLTPYLESLVVKEPHYDLHVTTPTLTENLVFRLCGYFPSTFFREAQSPPTHNALLPCLRTIHLTHRRLDDTAGAQLRSVFYDMIRSRSSHNIPIDNFELTSGYDSR